jgi:multiple sugar transport system substrate-binding protein
MKRTHRLRLLPAALVALGAAVPMAGHAASPATPARGHNAASFTLRFSTFFSPQEKTEFNKQILPQFQKQYPGVGVSLEPIPDQRIKAVAQIAAGTAADITNLGDGDVDFYASQNALQDLTPYVGQSFLNQYLPNTLTIGKVGSHQYALPKDYSTLAVYYNKDLFKAAGLSAPSSNFTWDELRRDALALMKKSGTYSVIVDPTNPRLAGAVVSSFGGRLISSDGKHVVGYMDSPTTVNAITFWTGLVTKDHVAPTPSQQASATNGGADPFAQGKVAMNITGVWPSSTYKATPNLHFGVVPFPRTTGGPQVNTIYYAGFAMTRATKHPKEAAALIKLMSGPVGDAIWGKTALPAIKSIADQSSNTMDPVRSVFIKGVKNINTLPGDLTGPDAAAAVGTTLSEGLTLIDGSAGTSVRQVLQIEAKKGQQALASFH